MIDKRLEEISVTPVEVILSLPDGCFFVSSTCNNIIIFSQSNGQLKKAKDFLSMT